MSDWIATDPVERVLDLVEKGEVLDEATALVGVSREEVRRAGLERRGEAWWAEHVVRGRAIDPDHVDRGLALIAVGVHPAEASDRAGVATPTLRRHSATLYGPDWWGEAARVDVPGGETVRTAMAELIPATTVPEVAGRLEVNGLTLRRAIIDEAGEEWWDANAVIDHLPPTAATRAHELLTAGLWVTDVAAAVGTTPEVVREHFVSKHGLAWWLRRVARRVSPETLEAGIRALEAGQPLEEAARAGDVSETTLRRQAIELMGVDWWQRHMRRRRALAEGVLDDQTLKLVLDTYRDGGAPAAAEILGTNASQMHELLRRTLGEEEYLRRLPARSHLDPALVRALVRDFEAGTPVAESATAHGVATAAAYRAVRATLGEHRYRRLVGRVGWASSGVDVETLCRKFEQGKTAAEIAQEAGLSEPSVRILVASRLGVHEYRLIGDDPSETLDPHHDLDRLH